MEDERPGASGGTPAANVEGGGPGGQRGAAGHPASGDADHRERAPATRGASCEQTAVQRTAPRENASEAYSAAREHVLVARDLERAARGRRTVRVWNPAPQVAFGRRDLRESGYPRARRVAADAGLEPTERNAGGRAVVHLGSTLAFAVSEPAERLGVRARYERVLGSVVEALSSLGVDPRAGEPERSFCPGEHSLSGDLGKLVGVAQRVRLGAALTSGVVLVSGSRRTAEVLDDVYGVLDLEFDVSSVSSLRDEGVEVEVEEVRRAVERELQGL